MSLSRRRIFGLALVAVALVSFDFYFTLLNNGHPLLRSVMAPALVGRVVAKSDVVMQLYTNHSNATNDTEESHVFFGPSNLTNDREEPHVFSTPKIRRVTEPPATDAPGPCQPRQRLVFVKTHKTGSSTVTTMLERYGHARGLNFALPRGSHVFSQFVKFSASKAYLAGLEDGNGSRVVTALGGYHILANHARYNRPEQDALIPGAFYFTIIREPASQLESAFNFFKMARYMPHKSLADLFGRPASSFYTSTSSMPMGFLRNGQLYDLGLEQTAQDAASVDAKVGALAREMDLVMIVEHFDESLVLLKRALCWEFRDIVYVSQLVRQSRVRSNISASVAKRIRSWNHGDLKLYRRFNETLWERIRAYGPDFRRDLDAFRRLKKATADRCLGHATLVYDFHLTGRYKLPADASPECADLIRLDTSWVPLLRKGLLARATSFLERDSPPKVDADPANRTDTGSNSINATTITSNSSSSSSSSSSSNHKD